MKIAHELSKLATNKYFLYAMVFLAATSVLGYLVTHQLNAVVFFALVGLLTFQFSKNMAIVLLVAVVATNFLMANKKMREGLENNTLPAVSNIEDKDPDIAEAIPIVKNAQDGTKVSLKKKRVLQNNNNTAEGDESIVDINNTDLNREIEQGPTPVGAAAVKKSKNNENFGPRLDYAATIEQSYQNLDSMLGSESIKQLTNDTQKLMKQQQTLFDTMQNMVPVLQGAQSLLKDFKIDGLADSLKGISGFANAPAILPKKT